MHSPPTACRVTQALFRIPSSRCLNTLLSKRDTSWLIIDAYHEELGKDKTKGRGGPVHQGIARTSAVHMSAPTFTLTGTLG